MVSAKQHDSCRKAQRTGSRDPDAPARHGGPALRWETIDWDQAAAAVRRLQRRIAKAVHDGKFRKAKALQWLLTHSWSAKVLAVRRVVTNKGKRTPGVDGVVWTTPEAKLQAAHDLRRRGYQPKPLRRLYIPKGNGKRRPLGIPTMTDRAMQALYHMAVAPVAETQADPNSYGFREGRGTADAIAQAFICLARQTSGRWLLEGDITACFDQISHDWLCAHVLMDTRLLRQWLTAGFVWQGDLFPTEAGTPQGGIVSPTLANRALDGLEAVVKEAAAPQTAHFIRYADDFLVIAQDPSVLTEKVTPAITAFLAERGLTLSAEKTVITAITQGVDFLGQHLRKYGTGRGKLLITPSQKNVRRFLENVKTYIDSSGHRTRADLVQGLNRKIRGWANYHRAICASRTFGDVDRAIYHALWRRERRLNPKMGKREITHRYFTHGPYQAVQRAKHLPIVRHIKIRGTTNPYLPEDAYYLQQLKQRRDRRRRDAWSAKEQIGASSVQDRGEHKHGSPFREA
jgi:RNA-directed DNA polymerase